MTLETRIACISHDCSSAVTVSSRYASLIRWLNLHPWTCGECRSKANPS